MNTEHVLVVGGGMDLPKRLRRYHDRVRTSVMCQLYIVPRLQDIDEHVRVLALNDDQADEEWLALAEQVHGIDPFTRVASFGERDQLRAALIGERLGLSMHLPDTVNKVHDKARMRTALHVAGVEEVRYTVADGPEAIDDWIRRHGGSWIVKPIDGTASAGVTQLDATGDVRQAYVRCQAAEHPGRASRHQVLVEEYLPGRQVSVETLSEDGEHLLVAVTEKYSDARTMVEVGHLTPATLSPDEISNVDQHVRALLSALEVDTGPAHTELVLTSEGPRTIETHLRLAGDEIPELVEESTGVDLLDCVVRQTFGERVLPRVRDQLQAERRGSAIWFAACDAVGRLERIEGVEDARAYPGVTHVEVEVKPGTELRGIHDSNSRLLWVRATAEDATQAVASAREAVARCHAVIAQTLGIDEDALV